MDTSKEYIRKRKWNKIMKNVGNGKCPTHRFIYWYGQVENNIGFNCPKCEKESWGGYSIRSQNIYNSKRY